MYNVGIPIKEIAEKEDMPYGAIYGVVRRYGHQQSAKDNKRSGRPPVLTDRDKSHIKILIDRNAFISYREIIEKAGLLCHRSTIRRWLIKEGIQHKYALRRPFLGPETIRKRKAFAERYHNEEESFFYNWVFSDEVSVDRTDGDYTKWSFYSAVSHPLSYKGSYSNHTTGRETT